MNTCNLCGKYRPPQPSQMGGGDLGSCTLKYVVFKPGAGCQSFKQLRTPTLLDWAVQEAQI